MAALEKKLHALGFAVKAETDCTLAQMIDLEDETELSVKKAESVTDEELGASYTAYDVSLGDLHDIGKNLVGIMIEAAGFEVIDLGIDVPAEKFVETVKANPDCKVVGVSALLTTTMESMRNTVKALIDAGCKDQVKIMVGGAPITQAFADEIGADAYTTDAASAAAKAKELASL